MNLIEAMVAAVVASIAVSGSAMVLAMGLRWSVRAEQRQDLHERQEAALLAAEATVRHAAGAAAPRAGDCVEAAAELEAALAAGGEGLGLSRPGTGEAVLVTVAGEDGQPERMRLFRPAALGLCGGEP